MNKSFYNRDYVKVLERTRTNGTTLYLVYKLPNGKRVQENTGLVLLPESTCEGKKHNAVVRSSVEKLKKERMVQLFTNATGFDYVVNSETKVYLTEYIRRLQDKSKKATSTKKHYLALANKIDKFSSKICIDEVDRRWLLGFFDSMCGLKDTSIKQYSILLTAVLSQATRDKIIDNNPFLYLSKEEKPKAKQAKREYLTVEELRLLESSFPLNTDKQKEGLNMFLFSCYTGLRFSDICGLQWNDIKSDIRTGKYYFEIKMQKTNEWVRQFLSQKALGIIGDPSKHKGYIFNQGVTNQYVRDCIRKAVVAAGIRKNISFHSARHTFAVNLLAKSKNVYDVSKLLGHTDIKTTQIYLDILPDKQIEAADMVDEIF